MGAETQRRPSPLQRRILIVLAALEAKRPGPVATRDIERVLEQGGDAPVYGPNLRASCRRLEAAGWLRTLRAPNMQLAVELTDTGRAVAAPLLADELATVREQQRRNDVRVLPVRPADTLADLELVIAGITYTACRGVFVVRLDGPPACNCGARTARSYGWRGTRCRSPTDIRPRMMPDCRCRSR